MKTNKCAPGRTADQKTDITSKSDNYTSDNYSANNDYSSSSSMDSTKKSGCGCGTSKSQSSNYNESDYSKNSNFSNSNNYNNNLSDNDQYTDFNDFDNDDIIAEITIVDFAPVDSDNIAESNMNRTSSDLYDQQEGSEYNNQNSNWETKKCNSRK